VGDTPESHYDDEMKRFLVVRRFSVTESDMPVVGRRSRVVIENEFPEITWEHSHVVVDGDGHVSTYCVYAAPSEDAVRAHSERLGEHRIETLHEIAGDVTPADFPAAS
jgi:hypothetical protein